MKPLESEGNAMDRETLISVIVPVYGVEAYLPRCVDSVLAQTYPWLEVILVDDGSPDRCGAICDAYAARDSRVTVIHKENGGLSSARNAGLDAARGDYIAFVDSDDWIEPEMYGHMLSLMERYGAKLAVAGRYDVSEKTGERKIGLCPEREEVLSGEELAGRIFLWDGCDSSACDKLYHRSVLEQFRYPEGQVCEDVPVTYRIVLEAGRTVLCDRPFYNYYHRAGSISTEKRVTDKTFHFSRHTARIYPYIRETYPGIEPQARYFRVRSLSHVLLLLDQADRETRRRFSRETREARRELRKHTVFFLRCARFSSRERITDLLLVLNLYRILRHIFHR